MTEFMNIIKELILSNSLMVYIAAFLLGIISSLNPHMLGMIPIYINLIVNNSKSKNTRLNMLLFIVSFILFLTSFGFVVSLLGMSLNSIMSVSYVLIGLIYLHLGLKLLGIRLNVKNPIKIIFFYSSRKSQRKSYIKNILAPLIFTPCSLPYIISLIGIIILKGNILNGVLILLSFSIGHSIVFLIFSFFYKSIIVLSVKIQDSKIIRLILGALLILLAVIFLSTIIQPNVHISH